MKSELKMSELRSCISTQKWWRHGEEARDSLEFTQPGVGYEGPQYRREVAEAGEGMVDGGGQVPVPVQVIDKIECQNRCVHTRTGRTHRRSFRKADLQIWTAYPIANVQRNKATMSSHQKCIDEYVYHVVYSIPIDNVSLIPILWTNLSKSFW